MNESANERVKWSGGSGGGGAEWRGGKESASGVERVSQ